MTRKMILIAGVAGLALTAPGVAKPDNKGGGNDGGRGQSAQQAPQQQQRAQRPQQQQQQRIERQQARQDRHQVQRAERQEMRRAERPQRMDRPQRMERQEMRRAERPQRIERAQRIERRQEARQQQRFERQDIRRAERQRIERGNDRREARVERRKEDRRVERAQQQRIERRAQLRDNRQDRREARFENRQAVREMKRDQRAFRQQFAQGGAIARPVVSREMRPMRVIDNDYRQRIVSVGDRFNLAAQTTFVPTFYRDDYYDTPQYYYRYDDDLGYLYRVNRSNDFVSALIPLFGGYGVGDPWPVTYRSSYVPYGYQSLYYDTPDYYYRYDGHGIYQIDAKTQLISALVALLAGGNGFGVGQVLPQSNYGIYNVPLAYRSSYYDTDDAWYRYGDGFIYQVDPVSYRVEERYPIYADYDSYLVGQPWPVAYPDYNVPYAYRDTYYDTPQYNYRYANGAIYQVDPTTQLITAIVSLLSGQNFAVGQPLPAGYSTYNVPFAYRDRFRDTEDDWYRYNDGYVYRVDADNGLIEYAYPVYA
jgi:hypothetical protein